MKRQTWLIILRATLSIVLISILLYSANISDLASILGKVNWWWLLAALILQFLCIFIGTWRWQILLSSQNMNYPFSLLNSLNLVGRFFNMFLPTTQGGDIIRIYELARHSQRSADSIISVLAERLLAFLALFVICWVALAAMGWQLLEGTNIIAIIAVLSGAFILFLIILLNRRLMLKIISLTSHVHLWHLDSSLMKIYTSLQELIKYKKTLTHVFWISLLNQFIVVMNVYFTALALDIYLPLSFFLMVIPVISVIVMAPVSIGGLGVREGAFVFFFSQQGIPNEASISLSLMFFGQNLVLALVGGIIYMFGNYKHQAFSVSEKEK